MHIEEEIGFEVKIKLGRGSFGTVYECYNPRNTQVYAVKVFQKSHFTKRKLDCFRKQAEILESIRHQNIVRFHSFRETERCLYLIMQFVAGGTLKQLMKSRRQTAINFTDEEASTVVKALLSGIKHLHAIGIIHRDLKPENILIGDAGDLSSIKIADFGLSAQVDSSSSINVKSQCGTLLYMAPQIFFQPSYSKAVDIWSCAVIMYMLCEGKHPIYSEGMNTNEFKQKLRSSEFPPLENTLAQDFICRISQLEYSNRYSVNEALKHPWITRNSQDQIPLSVSESIQSFSTSHLLTEALKFVYGVGKIDGHTFGKVPQEYLKKERDFACNHEDYRSRSPSCRRLSKNANSVIIKLKQIFNQKEAKGEKKEIQCEQISSPLMRRHQKLYSKLFNQSREEILPQKCSFQLMPVPDPKKEQKEDELTGRQEEQNLDKEEMRMIENTSSLSQLVMSSPGKSSHSQNQIGMFDSSLPSSRVQLADKRGKNLRKLNSFREGSKHEQKMGYFKSSGLKKSTIDLKDRDIWRSKPKRIQSKVCIDKTLDYDSCSPRKLQTSDSRRKKKAGKDIKPMIFGMGTSYF